MIISRRILRAPRDLVWRCLTEPAELARFWGPAGMHTPVDGIVVELRPGGRFETLMIGEHGSHRMVATFTEVVAPATLAWVEPASGMHTTSTLTDLGDGTTELVIQQRHVPEAMRTPESRAGFLTSLDKLEQHVITRHRIAETYHALAGLLTAGDFWDSPSLCEKWLVRHVVAHVTMPVRLTPALFGAEMAAAGGDFTVLSDTVAMRDAALPTADLLAQLRSPDLHAWQPPGGGAVGALSHAVIHSLDVTLALGVPPVAPADAVTAVLDQLTASRGTLFGVDLTGTRLEATDTTWTWGDGRVTRADSGSLVAFLSGRMP
ncbi:maleylpyruvate isomerase family mycothiol-dependent enzyme [Winogradskya humida]|uniref:Activator of Hsp90 ATPase-like protein n=1 Tax=Winogradskya humida TaxID=113566 RepID=A0ABQ3ZH57_9ACTN|nr:maleylpyruvate isomerase family mycothiol-dependent enzyme [Actinoplanes humidus]GIE17915.1 hypothetical protein Ahu01nite_010170 [Actinoplanes humidus]